MPINILHNTLVMDAQNPHRGGVCTGIPARLALSPFLCDDYVWLGLGLEESRDPPIATRLRPSSPPDKHNEVRERLTAMVPVTWSDPAPRLAGWPIDIMPLTHKQDEEKRFGGNNAR